MSEELNIDGEIYIPSKKAAEISGYTQDYIGQLARGGAITARRVSGLWYISSASLEAHKAKAEAYIPQPPRKVLEVRRGEDQTSVSFDGRTFVSAARAAKLTGYHQDYVSQLAREGKILARQVAGKWYVDQEGIQEHKAEKDSLLAAVQAESVGVARFPSIEVPSESLQKKESNEPLSYFSESSPLFPVMQNKPQNIVIPSERPNNKKEEETNSRIQEDQIEHAIPIRIVRADGVEKTGYVRNEQNALPPRKETHVRGGRGILGKILLTGVPALTIVVAVSLSWQVFTGKPVFAALDKPSGNALLASVASGGEFIKSFLEDILSKEIEYKAR
jgi:hypothetical protein